MKIRAYTGLVRIHFIRLNQYRISAINNVVSVLFYGLIQTSILIAFYRFGNALLIAMTVQQAVSYAWLFQTFHSISPIFEDSDLRQRIVDGGFVYDLCRPIDFYAHWFSRILAFRVTPLLLYIPLIGVPALLFPGLYRMLPPESLGSFVSFVAALGAAVLMSTSLSCLLSVMQIRVEWGRGLITFVGFVISFLSGGEVPLPILPASIVRILRWLPFAGLFDIPCSLYLGIIPASSAIGFLMRQLVWTGLFVMMGRTVLRRRLRTVVIQGG